MTIKENKLLKSKERSQDKEIKSVFYKNVLAETVHIEIHIFGPIDFTEAECKFLCERF